MTRDRRGAYLSRAEQTQVEEVFIPTRDVRMLFLLKSLEIAGLFEAGMLVFKDDFDYNIKG